MRRLSLLVAIACLASSSLTAASAFGFHGHHGYGYGCGGYGGYGGYYGGYGGGYYGGYRGFYGGYYGGPAFYGAGMANYSGPYFSGPVYGPALSSQPYRSLSYYGQPYYSAPIVGQPYASTPVYGAAGAAQGTAAPFPPAASSGPVGPAGYEAPATATVAVTIQDGSFQPAPLNVQPGTTVRWTNAGTQIHTASAQDNSWDSGDIAPGGTFSLTFQHPGTYYYHCRHHAGMQATIVVPAASVPTAAQPAGATPAAGVVAAGP